MVDEFTPENVRPIFGPDREALAQLRQIVDLYAAGKLEAIVVLSISADGADDWHFGNFGGATLSGLGRAKLYVGMLDQRINEEAERYVQRHKG